MDPNRELPISDNAKYRDKIDELLKEESSLTQWELNFLNSIRNWLWRNDANTLSDKQLAVLKDLETKVAERLGYE